MTVVERVFMGGGSSSSGMPGTRIQSTPEAFGAKRDGVALTGVSVTSGSATLTCSGANFTNADIGKTIAVYGAGVVGNGFALVTTINAVASATQITMGTTSSATLTAGTATRAVYGTDDSAAIEAAIADVVTRGTAARTFAGDVWFSDGIYMLTRAGQLGGPYNSNAQVRIPTIADTGEKFILGLKSTSQGGTFGHWNQTVPQKSGAVLYSTLVGGTNDATYGPPCMIAGPTPTAAAWSNMLLVIDGLMLVAQRNPSVTALHAGRIGQLHVKSLGVVADMTPGEMNLAPPTNDLGLGLRVPAIGNNHYVQVDRFAVEGFYYGMTGSDHLTAGTLVFVYTNTAMFIGGGGAAEHGMTIANMGVEASQTVLEGLFSTDGRFPVTIMQCNIETASGTAFKDNNNALVGQIYFTNNTGAVPSVSGSKNVRIINMNRYPGGVSVPDTPAVPATTVAYRNPFWRDATVYVTGGTVTGIAVDGITLGVTSGAIDLPSGREITLTYSVAPSWKWVLR